MAGRGDAARKAWALYRQKYGKKKSGGAGTRATPGRRRKRRIFGWLGKIGIGVSGAVPPALSTMDAADAAWSEYRSPTTDLSAGSALIMGLERFLNNLACGFYLPQPFRKMIARSKSGTTMNLNPGAGIPEGSFVYTTISGLVLVGIDRLIAWAFGNRSPRLPVLGHVTGS